VRWIRDRTGRFPVRPHYELDELETECEQIIRGFLERRYGQIIIPVPTDALRVLIESEAAALNVHADLSDEGDDIHGITEFFPGARPSVSIARELTVQSWHAPLYDRYCRAGERHKCTRGKLLPGPGERDWIPGRPDTSLVPC